MATLTLSQQAALDFQKKQEALKLLQQQRKAGDISITVKAVQAQKDKEAFDSQQRQIEKIGSVVPGSDQPGFTPTQNQLENPALINIAPGTDPIGTKIQEELRSSQNRDIQSGIQKSDLTKQLEDQYNALQKQREQAGAAQAAVGMNFAQGRNGIFNTVSPAISSEFATR